MEAGGVDGRVAAAEWKRVDERRAKGFDGPPRAFDDESVTLRIQSVLFDCHDPFVVASFWQSALPGWRRTFEEPDEIVLEPPEGSPQDGVAPDLLFLRVPDPTPGKNRVHIDLRPDDQDAEVERLISLGAKRVDIGQGDEVTWVVMADPEGNEFCVLRALTE